MSKNNPIAVRNLIKELIESSKQFAFEIQSDDLTLFLQANGEYSELFFKINKHEFSDKDNEQMYFIEYAPQTIHNETPIKYRQDYLGVKLCLRNWISVISQYPNIDKMENTKTIHESDLRELEFHQIEKKYPNSVATTSQEESTIFQKFLKLTNHQVIGGVIASILSAIIIWYFTKK